jgi:aminodeoxyfutalosine deaminase
MQIFAASYVLPISSPPIADGAIAVRDGRIVDVGPLDIVRSAWNAPVHDYPGSVITPGLVNAHTHLELSHFPSWKIRKGLDYQPRTYVDWVAQVIKIKRGLELHELELSLLEGLRISLEAGTTAVGDVISDMRLLPLFSGGTSCGRLFLEAVGHEPLACQTLLEKLADTLHSFNCGKLLAGLAPHAPHTVSPGLFQALRRLAADNSLPMMVHLAESLEEVAFMHDSTGKIAEILYPLVHWEEYLPRPMRTTSAAYLDTLGVLDSSTIAVHCTHITPADAEILKKRGVGVVLCPRSNDRLAVGRAPVHLLKKLGIPLALGTDSLASNDSLSLWDEMRFSLTATPGLFTPEELLRMASLGGAELLGVSKETGSLEKGKRADFLVVRPPAAESKHDLQRALIEEGRLDDVFVAGVPIALMPIPNQG